MGKKLCPTRRCFLCLTSFLIHRLGRWSRWMRAGWVIRLCGERPIELADKGRGRWVDICTLLCYTQ
jgi:hypothetical protein